MANHIAQKDQNSYAPAESNYPPSNSSAPTYAPASNAYSAGSASAGPNYPPSNNYPSSSAPSYAGGGYGPSSGPSYTPTTAPPYNYSQGPSHGYHQPNNTQYPSYGYTNPIAQPAPLNGAVHLPVITSQSSGSSGPNFPQTPDSTGQIAPHGMKPRVTATLWEDEGSLCFQVEAKGVCVARREDNHFINGTKLLNVAGMTRGRRDGILKSEKLRHVVKIGPMHLKGVWIPFDRALEFANKEKITQDLYPLFVHDIGSLIYHPSNSRAGHAPRFPAMAGPSAALPPAALHHHHSMSNSTGGALSQPPQAIQPHPTTGRPALDRAQTFPTTMPTPPTSASSMMGGMPHQGSSQEWNGLNYQGTAGSQPLAIDTGLARTVPTTPATTPPGNLQPGMNYSTSQGYDNPRVVPLYSAPMPQSSQYPTAQSQMMPYRQQDGSYMKNDMAPPARGGDQGDAKPADGPLLQNTQPGNHAAGDDEGDHENDNQYTHTTASYNTNRGAYPYQANGPDHSHLSPEAMTGSPQQNGSGRQTPRTTTAGQGQWNGYRQPAPASSVYSVISNPRGNAPNGNGVNSYSPPEAGNQYQSQPHGTPNSISSSAKRSRDEDDRPDSAQGDDVEVMKRRRTMENGSVGPVYGEANPGQQRPRPVATPRRGGR